MEELKIKAYKNFGLSERVINLAEECEVEVKDKFEEIEDRIEVIEECK